MTPKGPLNSALCLAIFAIAFVALTSATSISIPATSTFRTEIVKPSATIAAAAFNGTTLTNSTTYQWPAMVGESRLETRDKPARPESLCHGISPMCYAIAHGKRDCFNAWKQYDDEAYYCEYSSRTSGACTAILSCEGEAQQTCFKGSFVKEVFGRIHGDGFHCGNGGCGNYDIPASEISEGKDTCGVKLDYCFNCRVKNSDPPTSPLEGFFVVPPPPSP